MEFRDYVGTDPVSFVLSLNLHRRHLDTGQKAAIGVEALPHFEAEAKKRQLSTLKQFKGDAPTVEEKIPQRESKSPQSIGNRAILAASAMPETRAPQARDQAAQAVGVNPRK